MFCMSAALQLRLFAPDSAAPVTRPSAPCRKRAEKVDKQSRRARRHVRRRHSLIADKLAELRCQVATNHQQSQQRPHSIATQTTASVPPTVAAAAAVAAATQTAVQTVAGKQKRQTSLTSGRQTAFDSNSWPSFADSAFVDGGAAEDEPAEDLLYLAPRSADQRRDLAAGERRVEELLQPKGVRPRTLAGNETETISGAKTRTHPVVSAAKGAPRQQRPGQERATLFSANTLFENRATLNSVAGEQQVPFSERTQQQTAATMTTSAKVLPLLTFRQLPQQPTSSAAAADPLASNEAQWIPIVGAVGATAGRSLQSPLPAAAPVVLRPNRPAHTTSARGQAGPPETAQGQLAPRNKPLAPPPLPQRHLSRHRQTTRPRESNGEQQSTSASYNYYNRARHWHRRPRFNSEEPVNANELPLSPAKMYKKVLLCDKTIVSLEYVRNFGVETKPFGGAPTNGHLQHNLGGHSSPAYLTDNEIDEINDNFIDLDGNFDTLHVEMVRRTGETGADSGAAERQAGNDTATAERLASAESISRQRIEASRRYFYSSDDDPLVRCDMWDLEKGLKNRKPPEHILRLAVKADFDTVRDAINRCRMLSERTLPHEPVVGSPSADAHRPDALEFMSTDDLMSLFSMKHGLIPGTKWCGLGDQADSYNDLGPKYRIDLCCRAHDHCPIRSKPFRNDYGILNIGLYTKSHCDCDADFYRCLREVRSRTADMLGNLYFNVMKLQCMREEKLKVCREMRPIALGFERCVRYEDSPVQTIFKFTTPPVAY